MAACDCKKLVNAMLAAYTFLAHKKVNPEEVRKWIKLGKKNLKNLKQLSLKNGRIVVEKHRFIFTIGLPKGIQSKRNRLLKSGAGLRETRSDRVKWRNVQTAFNYRIKSGVITNLKKLEITRFMEDAQKIFQSQIKNALKKKEALKVYTITKV